MKILILMSALISGAMLVSIWYACFSWLLDKNAELFPALNLGFIGKMILLFFTPLIAIMIVTGGLMSRLLDFSIGE